MKEPLHMPPLNDYGLCLIRDDWFFRMQRKLGLVPESGLGVGRRALFWSMLAWLPLVIWSAVTGHLNLNGSDESVLMHFGVHVRGLVAIPLFILAEAMLNQMTQRLIPYFAESGLIREEDLQGFRKLLLELKHLRDSVFPWIVILGVILARVTLPLADTEIHELSWAGQGSATGSVDYGFGGWWFLYVTRSVFMVLNLAWLWRLILLGMLFFRIARLNLCLVPSHPDRLGGLGFLEQLPIAFAPVVFGLSAVIAAKWGHGVVYHHQPVMELKMLMIGYMVAIVVIFLAPYLAFAGVLQTARKQALLDYGKLVGEHGRLVRRRWILGDSVGEQSLLEAPEIGPVADTAAIYEAVQNMRTLPVGKISLMAVVIPAALPLLALLSVQIPIKDILLTLLKTLV